MPHTIEDLRATLFETLRALKDPVKPMELDRAREIANVAKVIVESAKVEVDMAKVVAEATGELRSTPFIPAVAATVPDRRQLSEKAGRPS